MCCATVLKRAVLDTGTIAISRQKSLSLSQRPYLVRAFCSFIYIVNHGSYTMVVEAIETFSLSIWLPLRKKFQLLPCLGESESFVSIGP
jgi:hypothetical protein